VAFSSHQPRSFKDILPRRRDRLHRLAVLFLPGFVVRLVRDRCGYLPALTPRQTEKLLVSRCSLSRRLSSKGINTLVAAVADFGRSPIPPEQTFARLIFIY
jgi:hypothetical protein